MKTEEVNKAQRTEKDASLDNLKKNSNGWGGARNGGGRPKGAVSPEKKLKMETEKAMQVRIMKTVDQLLNSQLSLAQGLQYLYRVEKDKFGKNKKPELVKSQKEIEAYLAGEVEDQSCYYFITTDKPNGMALDSLLDRVFGKSVQKTALTDTDGDDLFSSIDLEKARKMAEVYTKAEKL